MIIIRDLKVVGSKKVNGEYHLRVSIPEEWAGYLNIVKGEVLRASLHVHKKNITLDKKPKVMKLK